MTYTKSFIIDFNIKRSYIPRYKNIIFTSKMKMDTQKNDLLEYVGMGLGMALQTHVKNGNLYFESRYYFWDLFGLFIKLPDILSPGKPNNIHINMGDDRFTIRIEIRHRLFGLMFIQAGEFQSVIK